MKPISIRIYGPEALRLHEAVEDHPALSKHLCGRLAVWLGLTVMEQQPAWIDQGLREIRDAKMETST